MYSYSGDVGSGCAPVMAYQFQIPVQMRSESKQGWIDLTFQSLGELLHFKWCLREA